LLQLAATNYVAKLAHLAQLCKPKTCDYSAMKNDSFVRQAVSMYVDGFRSMTVGKRLWALIIIKLAILFLVFRLFFFPDILQENYDSDDARAQAVRTNLTTR
jgi:hypothetical protein